MAPSLREEHPGGHVEVVEPGVPGAGRADPRLEVAGGGGLRRDGLEALQVSDLGLDVPPALRAVVRGQEEGEAPVQVAPQVGDDGVRVGGASDDGVAVVAEHVHVDGVGLRDLDLVGLVVGDDDQPYPGDLGLPCPDDLVRGGDLVVEGVPERAREPVDEALAAADAVVGLGAGGHDRLDAGQEGRPGGVVRDELGLDLDPGLGEPGGHGVDRVLEAGELDGDGPAGLLEYDDAVVDRVRGGVHVDVEPALAGYGGHLPDGQRGCLRGVHFGVSRGCCSSGEAICPRGININQKLSGYQVSSR